MLKFLAEEGVMEILGTTLFLSTARLTPFVYINPIFANNQLPPGLLQTSIIIILSLPVFPMVFLYLQAFGVPDIYMVCLLVLKEFMIGTIIALLMSIPFWAVDLAGKFIESTIGFNAAASEAEISGSFGTMMVSILILFLLSTDWFNEIILATYYKSYEIWPPTAPFPEILDLAMFDIVKILDQVTLTGFLIALPIVALFLLADLVSGFVFKFTQAINPQFMMMSVKPLIFMLLLFPFVSVYMVVAEKQLGKLITVLPATELLIKPQKERAGDE